MKEEYPFECLKEKSVYTSTVDLNEHLVQIQHQGNQKILENTAEKG